MWSIGCIFAEMAQSRPLFAGDSEIGQIFKIFSVQGTHNESNWPDALKLKDYKDTFPQWKGIPLSQHVKKGALDMYGMDLLEKMVCLEPHSRISAKAALSHPYFDDLDKSQFTSV